jgi:CRISPR-associated exonuclease Cas4
MALGTVAHALHRARDRSVEGLMGLAPDRIEWSRRRVHEAKGGAGAKDAVSLQTAFYALLLMAATGEVWEAVTDILPERRHRPVPIDAALVERMLAMAADLAALAHEPIRRPLDGSGSARPARTGSSAVSRDGDSSAVMPDRTRGRDPGG